VEARADGQQFVSNEFARELPARFARLPGTIAIIFGREPATLAAASPAAAATVAISITIPISATIETSATTRAATTPTAWPAATATACGFRPGFVHLQSTTTDFFSIQARHSLRCFGIVRHFDERESTCTACFAVHGDVNSSDLSERFEERAQLRFRRLEIHVADKHVLHNFLSFKEWESAESAASMPGFSTLCAIVSTG
jgi:hypothetical protein